MCIIYLLLAETRRCFIAITFFFALLYGTKNGQVHHEGLILNGTNQHLLHADVVKILGENRNNMKITQQNCLSLILKSG